MLILSWNLSRIPLKIFTLSNTCYEFSFLNDSFSILFCEKPNCFQYSFVTIHYFLFIIINATAVQILFLWEEVQRKNACQKSTSQQLWHNGKSRQDIISSESMLDMEIFQEGYHIHIIPSLLYMISFIVVFPSLLNNSMPHFDKFKSIIWL